MLKTLPHYPVKRGEYIGFTFGGRQFPRTLKTDGTTVAFQKKPRLEETIEFVNSGRIEIPDWIDLSNLFFSKGGISKDHLVDQLTLKSAVNGYVEGIPKGSLDLPISGWPNLF